MKSVKDKRNSFLEAIRGLACLLVVFIHFRIEGISGTYIVAIARFAVPFFLILSGYYSYKGSSKENIKYAKKKLISVTKLTLIGTTVCVVANSYVSFMQGNFVFQWLLDIVGLKTVLKFVIFNRANWLSAVMYYLFMMIYVYVLYIIINKLYIIDRIYFVIPILLILNVVVCKYSDTWYYAGNFFLTGFPFFMFGNFLKKNNKLNVTKKFSTVFIVLGFILTIVENYYYSDCYCFVGTIFLSAGVFLLGISNLYIKVPGAFSYFGQNYSGLIFLLHCPIGSIIVQCTKMLGVSLGNFLPFVVIICTTLISMIVVFFQKVKSEYRNKLQ